MEGSSYVNDEFSIAKLFVKNENKSVTIKLRLNAFQNYFEFKGVKENYELRPDEIDSIVYNGETYVYQLAKIKKKAVLVPLVVIKENKKVSLYKRYQIRFIRAKKEQAYKDPQPSKFQMSEPEYYMSINSGDPVSLKNMTGLYKELPEIKSDLKKFLKINKIKKSDEKGLIYLSQFIDSKI